MLKNRIPRGQIIFQELGILTLDEILKIVPESIFLTKTHIDVCEAIVQLSKFSNDLNQLYVNLLVKHSKEVKIITSLIFLAKKYKIMSIESVFITQELLNFFIDTKDVQFQYKKFYQRNFIDKSQFKKLIIKFFIHKMYRFFFFKKKSNELVRSWVEISEVMYKEKYKKNCLVLIYPFYLNVKRHLKYIKNCKKNHYNFSLAGIPYSLYDLLKIFLFYKRRDYYYSKFEFNGYYNHAKELCSLNINTIYSSDEFEAGAFIMYKELFQKKVYSYNTAHGMSFGCPYLFYNDFHVYNNSQKKYYEYKSYNISYTVKGRENIKIPKSSIDFNLNYKTTFIYLEAPFENFNMKYEENLQNNILAVLSKICESKKYNIEIYIKLHPNNPNRKIEKLTTVSSLENLKVKKILFLCYFSAAYYDFKHLGEFIFIENEFTCAKDFYGEDNLNSIKLENLEQELLRVAN